MREQFQKIRTLLDEIQNSSESSGPESFESNYDALELPDLVSQIVDYLQPRLLPLEAAIYWYMFRHSVVEHGTQHTRVSVRGLCEGVITSSSGQGSNLAYGTIKDTLSGLEQKEVIRKAGDTNREGTPYLVRIPEEIPWCADLMKSAALAAEAPRPVDETQELDFYNIQENRLKVFERDEYRCYRCTKQLTRFSATLDHIQPISRGGDNSCTNLVTSCLHCNSQRGNRPIIDALSNPP